MELRNLDNNIEITEEFFEVSLNTEISRISTSDLIAYVSNTDKLIKSINCTLNKKYSVGYDDIEIDIIALEKGSFKIPMSIKKLSKNPTVSVLIGVIATSLMTKTPTQQIIIQDNQNVTININDETFLTNNNTKSSIGSIAKMAIKDTDIKDISFTHEKEDGNREIVTLNKESLSKVMYDNDEEDVKTYKLDNIKLDIISPVLENKATNWKVSYNGTKYTAKMTDLNFLETMNIKEIAFGPGDYITADFETIVTKTDKGEVTRHYIREVHYYPKYRKIKRKPGNLFNQN